MLKTDDFPTDHLSKLTEQINNWLASMIRNRRLPAATNGSTSTAYELGEQFVMVSMKDPEIQVETSPGSDLGKLVTETGRRHHQLKYKRRAVAYARSLVEKDEELCQLFATKLAPKVARAIKWLDAHETDFANGSWRVRLVTIPTFHTHAFLIQELGNGNNDPVGDSIVLVISAPTWLRKLPRKRFLTSREFLLGFKGKKPFIGLDGSREHS